jgi:hypothetical protein
MMGIPSKYKSIERIVCLLRKLVGYIPIGMAVDDLGLLEVSGNISVCRGS